MPALVVALNKCDLVEDEEMLELVEEEIKDLLTSRSRPTRRSCCASQGALDGEEKRARIGELLEARPAIPEPERDVDKPFLMCIEDVFSIEEEQVDKECEVNGDDERASRTARCEIALTLRNSEVERANKRTARGKGSGRKEDEPANNNKPYYPVEGE